MVATAMAFATRGIEHILFGADHLLFVLGLLLIVRSPWMLVKTIRMACHHRARTVACAEEEDVELTIVHRSRLAKRNWLACSTPWNCRCGDSRLLRAHERAHEPAVDERARASPIASTLRRVWRRTRTSATGASRRRRSAGRSARSTRSRSSSGSSANKEARGKRVYRLGQCRIWVDSGPRSGAPIIDPSGRQVLGSNL
jgi:hypothetical protein